MMRVDRSLSDCIWLGTEALAAAGSAGQYAFSILHAATATT